MSQAVTRSAHWAIRGVVVHGHGRGGSQLGFPTANVGLNPEVTSLLLPLDNWVYFGWGLVEGSDVEVFPLVMSVGFNPHFKDKALTVEAHFLHKFEADFYDSVIRVVSCGAVRQQAAFTTLDALVDIIRGDCRFAADELKKEECHAWKSHPFLMGSEVDGGVPKFMVLDGSASSSL